MKIVIINVAPLNRGDECLLDQTIKMLEQNVRKPQFYILSKNCHLNNKYNTLEYQYLPDLNEFWLIKKRELYKPKVMLKFFVLKWDIVIYLKYFKWLFSSKEKLVFDILLSADLVLSNPGSYLHDFYGNENRLIVFELLQQHKIKYLLPFHSFGPFFKKELKLRYLKLFHDATHVSVREPISLENLRKIGVEREILVGSDLAFQYSPEAQSKKRDSKLKVAMSFRKWIDIPFDDVLALAKGLCEHLIKKYDADIYFISTCQGIEEYVQDEQVHKEIYDAIDFSFKNRLQVDNNNYNHHQLIEKYGCFDLYVGMRLHAAIFTLLSAVPVYVLAIEHKVQGIFAELNIEELVGDIHKGISTHIGNIDKIINVKDAYSPSLRSKIELAKSKNDKVIGEIKKLLNEDSLL